MCFKTLKAFFRLKANDLCIDARPMNLWRASSMMLYLFSFCGSTWKVLAMANFSHQSTARVGHGHWDLTSQSRPQICRPDQKTRSLGVGGREGGRLTRGSSEIRRGIEFQMRGARKSFLAPVPHLYFIMTLFFEFINISRAEFLGKHLISHTVQINFLNWPQCNFRYCIFVAAFLVVLKQIVLLKPSHGSSSASVLSATAKMLEHLQAGTGITP